MLIFFLPEQIGRRKTMLISLFFAIISNALIVFGPSMLYKKIGFFLNGAMHLRIPLSFQHCVEMTPKPYHDIVLTFIGFFDSSTTGIACIFFLWINKSMKLLLIIYFGVGTFGCILYWAFIYESPRFLLTKNADSKEAREILGKMSKFNGKKTRIPPTATFLSSVLGASEISGQPTQ
jgi:MFS family permease